MKYRFPRNKQPARCVMLFAGLLVAISIGTPLMARAEAPHWKEAFPALRIQVDTRRNRVWVLNFDAVYLYDIPKRRLIKRIDLPSWIVASDVAICAPDLALAPSGSALVTSNVMPAIWEIDPRKLTIRKHNISLNADNDKDVGFTGIAFDRSGRGLYGVSSAHGSAWRIDLATGKAHKIRLSEPIPGACGVTVQDREIAKTKGTAPVLCVSGTRIDWRVELNPDTRSGRTIPVPCIPRNS